MAILGTVDVAAVAADEASKVEFAAPSGGAAALFRLTFIFAGGSNARWELLHL